MMTDLERQGKSGWVLVDSRVLAFADGIEMARGFGFGVGV
jgi:hypothetical protein